MFKHIGHKILAVVGATVTLGLLVTAWFYSVHQQSAVLAQNERTMRTLTESVIRALDTVMLAGDAAVALAYAERLRGVPEVEDFRILRTDGMQAFRDNRTIGEVNRRLGAPAFTGRAGSDPIRVLDPASVQLRQVLAGREHLPFYETDAQGVQRLTFLAPILNGGSCHGCHDPALPVLGVIKLTTSMLAAERDILKARVDSVPVIAGVLIGMLLLTGFILGRWVLRPIKDVTSAMLRASAGDLEQAVPTSGRDELAQMAGSFNLMAQQLRKTYMGLQMEQDKLTTIIRSARDAIIVTDANNSVVLVNPAASELLQKSEQQIVAEGFSQIVDNPDLVERWLDRSDTSVAETHAYRGRIFSVYAARIVDETGEPVGSAALLRDVTAEKTLEEELRRLSTTDPLTGLFNRRQLDAHLQKELDRAHRYTTSLSVLMLDVDHFKVFNDAYGHEQGDRVLKAIAGVLREVLREQDVPCRYGGEEFTAILPNTDLQGALHVAERFRRAVETMPVDGLRVTVSVGAACYPEIDVSDQARLVEAADKALYEAKGHGRNRIWPPLSGDA